MSGGRKKVLLSLSKAQLTNTSSRTGLTISSMLPPLPNAPLPSVACLQHEISWQTNQFCSEQSLSSYVHLVYYGRSANCAGSPIDCSNWVQRQLFSFHFLCYAWCQQQNMLILIIKIVKVWADNVYGISFFTFTIQIPTYGEIGQIRKTAHHPSFPVAFSMKKKIV